MTFCATGTFGRLFFRTGLIQRAYTPFDPDLLLKGREALDLTPYGIVGRVLSTPGHTCGSLSVVLHDGQSLVGDLVSSGVLLGGIALTGRSKSPPFEDDPHQVADELERLASGGSTTFYKGHGGPLLKTEVLRHVGHLLTATQHQGAN